MRHNQNGRRFRGRNGGGNNSGHHNNHGGGQRRSVNPRIQTFDSNGPDVRVRGNATQINEKYVALARDAMSAGDRVLAESYLQHAEHYQRMLNEMNEEFARNNPQAFQQQQQQQQQQAAEENGEASAEQPAIEMNDLDQAFLVGDRRNAQTATNNGAAGTNGGAETAEGEQKPPARHQQRQGRAPRQPKEAESA